LTVLFVKFYRLIMFYKYNVKKYYEISLKI